MKKFFILLFVIFFAQGTFAKSKNEPMPDAKGYSGTLPSAVGNFQKSVPTVAPQVFDSVDGFNDQNQIKPAPRDNPAFVNIVLKKDKTSRYINDINEVIPIVEKVAKSIENKSSIQKFSAQAYYLKENVEYIRHKYQDKSESSYVSFKKLMQLNMQIQSVVLLRSESATYAPYLAYADDGYIYNSNNVNQQLDYLLTEINSTLIVLREAR